jgi:hypothetical protein
VLQYSGHGGHGGGYYGRKVFLILVPSLIQCLFRTVLLSIRLPTLPIRSFSDLHPQLDSLSLIPATVLEKVSSSLTIVFGALLILISVSRTYYLGIDSYMRLP